MKTNIFIKTVFLVIISTLIFANVTFCQSTDGFHVFTYFNQSHWSLKFKDVPSEIQYIPEFPMEALRNDSSIIDISPAHFQRLPNFAIQAKTENGEFDKVEFTYWINTSVFDAELAMLGSIAFWRLNGFNFYHSTDFEREEIGDNCWYSSRDEVIYFIRNNVRIEVRDRRDSPNPDLVLAIAKKIDALLQETEKVDDASLIAAPIITSIVHVDGSLEPGSRAHFNVSAVDPKGQVLTYYLRGAGISQAKKTGKGMSFIILTKEDFPPNDNFIKCWVWNEDYIVSSIDYFFQPPR